VPTAFASAGLVKDINSTLSAFRGWMLTGTPPFKQQRAAVWDGIARIRGGKDRLSANWTNPANVEKWSDSKVVLDEFAAAQQRVEDIAHTVDEQPASKLQLQEETEGAVGAIRTISETAGSISAAVEEQGAATSEISRSVQQVAQGTQEVTSKITCVSQAATETV
jgi:methyl-accepting chemotaxis protein